MKSKIVAVFLCLAILALAVPLPTAAATYSQDQAVTYLKSHDIDEWSVMGLAAANALSGTSLEFLKTPVTSGKATDYEKRILALAAAGQNPSTYGAENFVAALKGKFDGAQIGDPQLLNDDVFGILALAAVGEGSGAASLSSKAFLLGKQNADGGWGYAPNTESDSNDTAMAVSALLAAGMNGNDTAVSRARSYLSTLQQSSGGYAFSPGFSSDSASTAWVLAAQKKAGQTVGAQNLTYLESLELADGSFRWQAGDASGSPIMTAYALITLAGGTYPVTGSAAEGTSPNSFQVCIKGQTAVLWNGPVTLPKTPPKAIDTVTETAKAGNFTYSIITSSFGPYVQTISNDAASGMKGWLYLVNGAAPDIGAADYTLKTNDTVLWYYGQFGDPAPTCPPPVSRGQGAQQSAGLSVTIEIPSVAGAAIAFSVTPGSLNFGTLRPGQTNSQNLTLNNTGTAGISVTAEVQDGAALFRDNLKLDSTSWQSWNAKIPPGKNQTATATLTVPANISTAGTRNATLIFWASP